jgi:hypothetical protein
MDLKILQDTPPWDWPRDAGKRFQETLIDRRANESDRLVAAEVAGDLTVINDELADSLTAIIRSPDEPEGLRARAAISLGAVLEQADTYGFEDPDDVPIIRRTFRNIQNSLRKLHFDNTTPRKSGGEFWRHRCALPRAGTRTRSGPRIPAETKTGC